MTMPSSYLVSQAQATRLAIEPSPVVPGPMAETIDDLTYDYEDAGQLTRRQLEKNVLTKGAWSTIMYKYEELDRSSGEWRPPKVAIVRYKKWQGQYRKQSGFNISSEKQARQIIQCLEDWFGPATEETEKAPPKKAAKKTTKKK